MKAIILAAGVSRRLYPLTYNTPKSLLKLNEIPIIDYQLNALRSVGVKDVIIVLGYYKEKFLHHFKIHHSDLNFTVVTNHHFFETNTAYSVLLCNEHIAKSNVLLMNADVLYPIELVKRLVNSKRSDLLAVEVKECGNEEVKVIAGEDNRIVAIGKKLIQENSLGEFIGVAKLSNNFLENFFESLDNLILAGGKSDYFEAAIDPILSSNNLYYEDVTDLPCIEIDFLEDYENAQNMLKNRNFNI